MYSRWRRPFRLLGLGRNPLCRPVDRLDGAFRIAAVTATLAVVVLSVLFGVGSYHRMLDRVEAQKSTLNQVPVLLLDDPAGARTENGAVSPAPVPGVQAKWTLPDGTIRTGAVYTPVSARRGTSVDVWMNDDYVPVRPPAQPTELQFRAIVDALGCVSLFAVLVWGAFGWALSRLNRRRDAEWAREWIVYEREWRHRSH
ncbi:hypothetical protein [Cryptosporangium phraense]|uniref:Uncharacterized protein n=1 Tax=Cryptosporangium phraense TaxID=2593070 RepID=A0A545AWH1_9ACTN|nr:hypothetical protein [Cryptosporangium phraense]TQS45676.1 hypothetical protein FL583_08110 [Cryptosporangium phraense]